MDGGKPRRNVKIRNGGGENRKTTQIRIRCTGERAKDCITILIVKTFAVNISRKRLIESLLVATLSKRNPLSDNLGSLRLYLAGGGAEEKFFNEVAALDGNRLRNHSTHRNADKIRIFNTQ